MFLMLVLNQIMAHSYSQAVMEVKGLQMDQNQPNPPVQLCVSTHSETAHICWSTP